MLNFSTPTQLNRSWLVILVVLTSLVMNPVAAHTINYNLLGLSQVGVGWIYLQLGYEHIIPSGFDHVLFILSIFLLSPKLSTVLWQATAFTVAHSITLGLAMYGVIKPLPSVIEPIIALSIFFVAVENILVSELKPGRILIIFVFGLVHGMGFASALTSLGLPPSDYALSLLSFNVGVELGQITVILLAWLLFGKWFSGKPWYRNRVVTPMSAVIALIAIYWTIERTFY